jgi:hypothetical protein
MASENERRTMRLAGGLESGNDSTSEDQESISDTFCGLPLIYRSENNLQSSDTDTENIEGDASVLPFDGVQHIYGDVKLGETVKEQHNSRSRDVCDFLTLHNDIDEEEYAGSQPKETVSSSSDMIDLSFDAEQPSLPTICDEKISKLETNEVVCHKPLCGLETLKNQVEVAMDQACEPNEDLAQMSSQQEFNGEIAKFSSFSKRNVPQDRRREMASFRTAGSSDIHSGVPYCTGNGDKTQITSKNAYSRAILKKDEEENLIRLLGMRSAHLPGLNWYQDWLQFMKNNHPMFGLCFHHPLHPLRVRERIYICIASVSFGLLATNCVFLYYMMSAEDFDEKIFRIYIQVKEGTFQPLEISNGMAALWIYNGIAHSIFDLSLWHISACNCFSKRHNFARVQTIGRYIVVAIACLMAAVSSCFILYRTMITSSFTAAAMNDDMEDEDEDLLARIFKLEGYAFILGYFIELLSVYCLVQPVLVTIMFSGVFGCVPGLGGRPKDIVRELNSLLDQRDRIYIDFEIV